jgi:hypothetical protein
MAGLFATPPALGASPVGKTFRTLTIGFSTYTNVTITDVAGGSIFLQHARGFESLRIDSLDANTLSELGLEAPALRGSSKAAKKPPEASPPNAPPANPFSSEGRVRDVPNLFGKDGAQLDGPIATVVYCVAGVGFLLLLVGHILFIVVAFQASPWWGVGVLFGGFTCGIVPLVFFFTHLEACKKAFVLSLAGFLLFVGLGIAVPNFVRAKAAAKAKERSAIPCRQVWA